jgi:uncharacterized DUF497 family protein
MEISYDPAKRAATLEERGLDFVDAPEVFSGPIAAQCMIAIFGRQWLIRG